MERAVVGECFFQQGDSKCRRERGEDDTGRAGMDS